MIQMGVDLDLSAHLRNHIAVDNLFLGEYLDCYNVFGLPLSGKVYMSEPKLCWVYFPRPKGRPISKSSIVQS